MRSSEQPQYTSRLHLAVQAHASSMKCEEDEFHFAIQAADQKFNLKQRACFTSPAVSKSLSPIRAEGIACGEASGDGKQACRTTLRA